MDGQQPKNGQCWISSTGISFPNFPILNRKYECCVTFCDETDANGDNNSSTNKTRGKHI
jgi:hypothetical protein